ncbi:MAG: sigma-70 family RNA polymerase sigma factor [Clostridia bacterium]|nr:sigma-70 family RNA polymerase sigma factor [Clostridia bacterium]MBR2176283.1 sigma-70 family RNA polymerase sigma factor [Clostridia bacterium]
MQSIGFSDKLSSLSDEELAALCKDGMQEAFGELSVRYIFIIRNKASNLYNMGIEADDLFQEGLIGLNNAVRTFDENGNASFRTYASVCIHNRMVSAVRSANSSKNKINHLTVSLTEELDVLSAPHTEPESALMAEEDFKELSGKIRNSLSELEMQVVLLYIDGYSYDEIAEKLRIPKKSCDSAMQRVRKKLKGLKLQYCL